MDLFLSNHDSLRVELKLLLLQITNIFVVALLSQELSVQQVIGQLQVRVKIIDWLHKLTE